MGECLGFRRSDVEVLNDQVAGIVVASSGGSHKVRTFGAWATEMGLRAVIGGATPNQVEEINFNGYTGEPAMIATLKLLQHARSNPQALCQGVLGVNDPTRKCLYVASDVVLDGQGSNHQWVAANKVPAGSSHDDVYQIMKRYVVGYGAQREARLRVGEAVFEPQTRRGGVMTKEKFIGFKPLLKEELALYVFGLEQARHRHELGNVEEVFFNMVSSGEFAGDELDIIARGLGSSNMGLRWEHPIVSANINRLGSVFRDDPEFEQALKEFRLMTMGVSPARMKLLRNVLDYSCCPRATRGNFFPAHIAYQHLGTSEVGDWQVFHP
jgi:hypothetical protein